MSQPSNGRYGLIALKNTTRPPRPVFGYRGARFVVEEPLLLLALVYMIMAGLLVLPLK